MNCHSTTHITVPVLQYILSRYNSRYCQGTTVCMGQDEGREEGGAPGHDQNERGLSPE